MQLSFLGLFVFRAPFLPWVMIGLSVVMHGNWPKDELCGIAVGHGEFRSLLLLRVSREMALLMLRNSLLLLQRHLSGKSQWSTTAGSSYLVAEVDKRQCGCGC